MQVGLVDAVARVGAPIRPEGRLGRGHGVPVRGEERGRAARRGRIRLGRHRRLAV
jgi:hypothetical protein